MTDVTASQLNRSPGASIASPVARAPSPARAVAAAPPRPGKALVMGEDTRGFLATVRSLGRKGIEVHAAPSDFRMPALASRYITRIHDVPPWMGDGTRWLDTMRGLLAAERYDLIIPCDERNLLPLQRCRAELEPLARLAIPSDEAIAALFDKAATRELAERVGVPVARGRLARQGEDAHAVLAELGTPVVIKPRRSYTLDGLSRRSKVHVVSDPGQLAALLEDGETEHMLLESCFEGHGLGLSILAHEGRLLQAFEHHRVHERSGSSFYRVSAAPNPELVEACAAVAAGVRYTGIAMFEFKQNDNGGWILLEVNARPWGSLPLPVALGVDFPYRWYQLLVDGVVTPPVPYRVGVYGRNLLPDLVSALADAKANNRSRLDTAAFVGGRMLGMRRTLWGGEVHDVLVRDDPAPARKQFAAIGQEALERARRTGAASRTVGRRSARRIVRTVARGPKPIRITFICQGNICRSPFAAALLRSLLAGQDGFDVTSAGTMPRPGRPVPNLFQAQATRNGIDLAAHRSSWLDRDAVNAASLIVIFDMINLHALRSRYPDLAAPVIKLGDLAGLGDIADPVDGDEAVASGNYAQIRTVVTILAELLTT